MDLSLNLQKGQTYDQIISSNSTVSQFMKGQQISIGISINGHLSFYVKNTPPPYYDIEVTYKSLSMSMQLPQGNKQFSSEKNDGGDIFSSLLAEMKDRPFYIRITKKGEIKEVMGMDSLVSSMFAKFPQLTEEQKLQIKDQFMKAYGETAFRSNFKMFTAIFPDHPVDVGDKWIVNTQLSLPTEANITSTYQYKGSSNTIYTIHGISKIETANKDAYRETNGIPLKYDIKGTMVSDIKINKESGWIQEAQITQETSGNVQVKGTQKTPEGMTIPMTMNSKTRITSK